MPARLLIVDDDVEVLDVIALYLRSLGHQVRTARTGGEAMELLGQPFDIAIVDWSLADRAGREVLAALRTLQSRCEIVVTTGHSSDSIAAESARYAVGAILRKPFTMRALSLRIDALLERKA